MNRRSSMSAAEFLATATEERIATVLGLYGELKQARRMAAAIVREREAGRPVDTVGRLTAVMKPFISPKHEKKEMAQLFQALRIEVNGEMQALEQFLAGCLRVLKPGGRLAVITFHSLEDRIVKQTLKTLATGCTCPPQFPVCVCGKKPKLKLAARKPVTPGPEELAENPRARSAKLRIAERI